MNSTFIRYAAVLCLIFVFFIAGCAAPRPQTDPVRDKKANNIVMSWLSKNSHVKTSKGLGWAKIETPKATNNYRIAWAAVYPDKLRITFMLMGMPAETIIATGEKVIFFSHTQEHATHHVYEKDPNLDSYIQVPVHLSEIIAVLSGRLPIKEFDDVYFSPFDDSDKTLVLFRKQKGPVQHITLAENSPQIKNIISTNSQGESVYQFNIHAQASYDFGSIPSKMRVTDNNNQTLTLTISRFIANPEVKESVFELTEER